MSHGLDAGRNEDGRGEPGEDVAARYGSQEMGQGLDRSLGPVAPDGNRVSSRLLRGALFLGLDTPLVPDRDMEGRAVERRLDDADDRED